MKALIATLPRRFGWTLLALLLAGAFAYWTTFRLHSERLPSMTDGEIMARLIGFPALVAVFVLALLSACAQRLSPGAQTASTPVSSEAAKPFVAQVVGLQWLNPLQRRDYPTEWQVLWTLGLVKPNKNDSMVQTNPQKYSTVQAIASIAMGGERETFSGFHKKYVGELVLPFRRDYFTNAKYFYTVKPEDKSKWRELAGIRVECALPVHRPDFDPIAAGAALRKEMMDVFEIGSDSSPGLWTRADPPDIRVTLGGTNAGFASLTAALDYLQAHPQHSVWVMNWDAPSFPPNYKQLNENMALLILAGPQLRTERAPLAWIGYPASRASADFAVAPGGEPREVQAWHAGIEAAARNAGASAAEIGYVVHDAGRDSDRLGRLAQTLTARLPEFDFLRQSFDMPALLGETGAGTALTNVVLGIGHANHYGKPVLVAGTREADRLTALVVMPPAQVRPIDAQRDWFRARSEANAYLPWWGLRTDAKPMTQGYSD